MPSKSSNRTRARGGQPAGASMGTSAPRRGIDLATLFQGAATGYLRRGPEVDRFNELARRDQDQLTGDEADELYRFRIRRLRARADQIRRAMNARDEGAIRRALADFNGRLAELHQLEEARVRAGLPVVSDHELTPRDEAVAALMARAEARPRGLINGWEGSPVQPAGSVRLTAVAFAPRQDDVPVYVLAPPSIPSDSLAGRVGTVAAEGAQIRVVHDPADIPRDGPPPLVLNWGSERTLPDDLVALNQPAAVEVASDQVSSLPLLGDLAPRTVVNPQDIPLLGGDRIVAKRRRGSRGSDVAVLPANAPAHELANYDLFQEFIPDRQEYRVSVLSGRVVSAYARHRPEGSPSDDPHPGWRYERASVLPRSVVNAARDAAQRVGLDYAGIDVVEDRSTGRIYCLEANAAPGMSEDTVRSLYAHVQQALRGRTSRAS
jgi:hypothetical protein